jgi:hypothetical protein
MTRRASSCSRAAIVVVAALAAGGSGCRREAPVATTLEVTGAVHRGNNGTWQVASPGTPFGIGDLLQTFASSQARLALAGGGVIRVGENARLRFQRGGVVGQRAPDIAVELGSAEVEETTDAISIFTAMGPARIERGAHVRVRADGETASLEVVVGRAVMLEQGREVPIDAGGGVRIRLGSAEVERFALKVGPAVVEQAQGEEPDGRSGGSPTSAGSPDAGAAPSADEAAPSQATPTAQPAAAGRTDRGETGRADISLTAGESATVHDGRSALAVRLRLGGLCPGDAVVELDGGGHRREQLTGASAVVLRLKSGTRSYRVRCAGDRADAAARASGALSLRRDTGNVPLARRAPTNVIDADGRRYTVLFQTRLPQLTLAWPDAPAGAGRLELHLDSGSGERVVAGASPTRPLPSGTVREGTYTFWYSAPDGKQSRKTTIAVRFDNAAPTAQFFRTGASAGKDAHGPIAIDGVTVEGAKISVAGEPLAVDGHGRFRTEAAPLEGDDAVAVRFDHPRTGVHYYVRRRAETR